MGAANGTMMKIIHKDNVKNFISSAKSKKERDADITQINQHNHSTTSGHVSKSLENVTFPTEVGLIRQVSQKKPASGPWAHKQINVTKLKAWIDKRLTTIDDTCAGVLKYKTPHFR